MTEKKIIKTEVEQYMDIIKHSSNAQFWKLKERKATKYRGKLYSRNYFQNSLTGEKVHGNIDLMKQKMVSSIHEDTKKFQTIQIRKDISNRIYAIKLNKKTGKNERVKITNKLLKQKQRETKKLLETLSIQRYNEKRLMENRTTEFITTKKGMRAKGLKTIRQYKKTFKDWGYLKKELKQNKNLKGIEKKLQSSKLTKNEKIKLINKKYKILNLKEKLIKKFEGLFGESFQNLLDRIDSP